MGDGLVLPPSLKNTKPVILGREMRIRVDTETYNNICVFAEGHGLSPTEMAEKIMKETVRQEAINGLIAYGSVQTLRMLALL